MPEKAYNRPTVKVRVEYFAVTPGEGGFRFNQMFVNHLYSKLKIDPAVDSIGVRLSFDNEERYLYFQFYKGNIINGGTLSIIGKNNSFRARPVLREEKWILEYYKTITEPMELEEMSKEKNKWRCNLSKFKNSRILDIKEISSLEHGLRGCYLLYNSDELVYIGRSTTNHGVKKRIMEHLQDKLFDKIQIFEFHNEEEIVKFESSELEKHYQSYNKYPKYNKVAGKQT